MAVVISSIVYNIDKTKSFGLQNQNEECELSFHIYSDEVTAENRKKLQETEQELNKILPVKIFVHIVDNIIFAECAMWKGSYATFYKTVADRFLPREAERILFIDVDVLVVSDVRELIHYDLQGKTIAGVPERQVYTLTARKGTDTFNFENVFSYFNAGVIVIDLQRWRQNNCEQKVLEFLKKFNLNCAEQDAFNAVLVDDVCHLPYKWNKKWSKSLHPKYAYLIAENFRRVSPQQEQWFWEGLKNPSLIHYSVRPWAGDGFYVSKKDKEWYEYPHLDLWWEYAEKTPGFSRDLMAIKQSSAYKKRILKNEIIKKLLQYSVVVYLLKMNDKMQWFVRKIEKPFKTLRNKYRVYKQKFIYKVKQK